MKTQQYSITLDGVTYEGPLPYHVSEKRPDLGPLTDGEDLRRFNLAVARQMVEHGLRGPQSLRLCRKVGGLGIVEFAALLGCDRKTVQRWESGESPVPRYAMILSKIAALSAEGIQKPLKELAAEVVEPPKTVHVEAAA